MENIKNKNILVTGANGFLGSFVIKELQKTECKNIYTFKHSEYDLTIESHVINLFNQFKDIDIIIHIAADIGGIGYSSKHPAKQFYNNVMMNLNILHQAYLKKIETSFILLISKHSSFCIS